MAGRFFPESPVSDGRMRDKTVGKENSYCSSSDFGLRRPKGLEIEGRLWGGGGVDDYF